MPTKRGGRRSTPPRLGGPVWEARRGVSQVGAYWRPRSRLPRGMGQSCSPAVVVYWMIVDGFTSHAGRQPFLLIERRIVCAMGDVPDLWNPTRIPRPFANIRIYSSLLHFGGPMCRVVALWVGRVKPRPITTQMLRQTKSSEGIITVVAAPFRARFRPGTSPPARRRAQSLCTPNEGGSGSCRSGGEIVNGKCQPGPGNVPNDCAAVGGGVGSAAEGTAGGWGASIGGAVGGAIGQALCRKGKT